MLPGETVLSGAESNEEDERVSELKVMRSNAGYYIGTTYMEEYGEVPNTRETGYFRTKEEAIKALSDYKVTGLLTKQR